MWIRNEHKNIILTGLISPDFAICVAKVPIINPSGIRWDNKKKIAKAFDLGLWSFK